MAIEIVDLPSYKIVIFHSYVSLPEGKQIAIVFPAREIGVWNFFSAREFQRTWPPLQEYFYLTDLTER